VKQVFVGGPKHVDGLGSSRGTNGYKQRPCIDGLLYLISSGLLKEAERSSKLNWRPIASRRELYGHRKGETKQYIKLRPTFDMCRTVHTYVRCLVCNELLDHAREKEVCRWAILKMHWLRPKYDVLGRREAGTTMWVRCRGCEMGKMARLNAAGEAAAAAGGGGAME
jgi:hypothetical protein